jgi:hypothetical protein
MASSCPFTTFTFVSIHSAVPGTDTTRDAATATVEESPNVNNDTITQAMKERFSVFIFSSPLCTMADVIEVQRAGSLY